MTEANLKGADSWGKKSFLKEVSGQHISESATIVLQDVTGLMENSAALSNHNCSLKKFKQIPLLQNFSEPL